MTKNKLNSKVKSKWVKALRSGKYVQGKNVLRQKDSGGNDKFCCLGVLCDIFNKETSNGKWNNSKDSTGIVKFNNEKYYVPKSVNNFIGLDLNKTTFKTAKGKKETLAELNDKGNNYFNFNRIADIIETQL